MMRPYLAVIADAFRAALASRVLWVAFIAIWVLLGALAPIGYREEFTTTFRWQDFHNGTQMKRVLARGLVDPDRRGTAVGRLAAAMPADVQRLLQRVGAGDEVRIPLDLLSDALNDALDDESWYDAEAWRSTLRLRELRELDQLSENQLSETLRRRRARLRIEAALPGVFEARSSRSIMLTYAGFDFPASFAVDKTQFVSLINQWVVPTLINWLLGFALIFLGILVTASIVPDMLQPGSLHLLLSKPVSRPMLFISKFIGGCVFVFLCVTQLVVGLWLISGLRLDIWNIRLLWCIPVAVFLFAVFYSVSAVAGLRWRSPILAIGITCVFGACVLMIGVIGGLFDNVVTRPDRIRSLTVAGNSDAPMLFAATRGGGLTRYSAAEKRWIELIESDAMTRDRVLSPVRVDASHVATARVRGGRFNPFGSGAIELLLISQQNGWQPQPSLRLPVATTRLLMVGGDQLLAMNTGGLLATTREQVLAAAGETIEQHAEDADAEDTEAHEVEPQEAASGLSGWLSGWTNQLANDETGFHSILPERMAIVQPAVVKATASGDGIVVFSRGRLVRLQRAAAVPAANETETANETKQHEQAQIPPHQSPWSIVSDRTLEGDLSQPAVLAVGASTTLVARRDEPPLLVDSHTLETEALVELDEGLTVIDACSLSSGNRFVVVTSDGYCRVLDGTHLLSSKRDSEPIDNDNLPVISMGAILPFSDVLTVTADPAANRFFVVHDVDSVGVVEHRKENEFTVAERIEPEVSGWRMVNRYVMTPLRTLTPQTGELGQTVAAIISGESSVLINENSEDDGELVRYEILRPVLSCAVFIAVMLTVGCVYFSTRDF